MSIIPIDYEKLTLSFSKVFYYDSLPSKKTNESTKEFELKFNEKKEFLENLRMLNRFHVYEGHSRYRRRMQVQKGVDTMIAIDMLKHAFRKNMQQATLLAGDLDFLPLLDALVMEGMYTRLWYDPSSVSKDLITSADSKATIGISNLYHLFPNTLQKTFPKPFFKEAKFEITSSYNQLKKGVIKDKKVCVYEFENEFHITIGDIRMTNFPESQKNIMLGKYFNLDKLELYIESFYGMRFNWK